MPNLKSILHTIGLNQSLLILVNKDYPSGQGFGWQVSYCLLIGLFDLRKIYGEDNDSNEKDEDKALRDS